MIFKPKPSKPIASFQFYMRLKVLFGAANSMLGSERSQVFYQTILLRKILFFLLTFPKDHTALKTNAWEALGK